MFEFNANDTKGYKGRIISDTIRVFIISVIASVIGVMLSGWMVAVIIFALIFIVQFLKVDKRNRYYITHLKIDAPTVTITYTDRTKEENVIGVMSEFTFKKRYAFSKSKVASLAITYKGKILITQYESGEWKENVFDKIIAA